MRLRDLAGQDHAVALLMRAVASGRLAHASLYDGPDGVGKRSAAIGLALALCCPQEPQRGCGTCDVCRRILTGQHPDVRVMLPSTTQYVIDQAREVVSLASSRPHEAPARVVIIDQADCLSGSSANCLLKTLEEPFAGNHIVLVTAAPDRLLPTIRSRTQRVRFLALKPATLMELGTRRGIDAPRAELAAALAGGSAARFFQLVEGEADAALWQAVDDFRRAAASREMGPVFDTAAAFSEKESRADLPEMLLLLAGFYRDALALAAGASELVLLRDRAPAMAKLTQACPGPQSVMRLRKAVVAVMQARGALAGNMNAVTVLEKMMLDIRDSMAEAA